MRIFCGGYLGGDDVWAFFEWDLEKALVLWKEEIDELMKECMTISDIMLSFYYFKYDVVINTFGNGTFKKKQQKVFHL